jgi:uncharacterized membrane protein
MRDSERFVFALIIISILLGCYIYSIMPPTMASHWDANGEVNGYMPRFWAVFLLPMILVFMFLIFLFVPRADPLRANIEKFRKHYDLFVIWIFIFMFYIYVLTLIWNLGVMFSMTAFLAPAFGLLFFLTGSLISKAKTNWSIGIRTPWTMSSENVWDKTHKFGGMLFKLAGLLAFFALIIPKYAIFFILFPVIAASMISGWYSYHVFEQERQKKPLGSSSLSGTSSSSRSSKKPVRSAARPSFRKKK